MKNTVSIFQEVFCTSGSLHDRKYPFRMIEHVKTETDGVRSRITSHGFATLEEAKEVLKKNGYSERQEHENAQSKQLPPGGSPRGR